MYQRAVRHMQPVLRLDGREERREERGPFYLDETTP